MRTHLFLLRVELMPGADFAHVVKELGLRPQEYSTEILPTNGQATAFTVRVKGNRLTELAERIESDPPAGVATTSRVVVSTIRGRFGRRSVGTR